MRPRNHPVPHAGSTRLPCSTTQTRSCNGACSFGCQTSAETKRCGPCQGPATAEQVVGIRAAAARAWRVLQARVVRLERQGRLGAQSVDEAAAAFHALCEGMAALEIRGVLTAESAERQWRTALTDLVERFNISN